MIRVTFHDPKEIAEDQLVFAVVAARYQDQWVFCRHKDRKTWEIPGGHREHGETIMQAAQRELKEETGAAVAKCKPVAVYEVSHSGKTTYGMLFYADIRVLDVISEYSEIAEIAFMENLPENLTYPEIQPELYYGVQGWLNLQSNADELWDVYDENRKLTGKLHRRGDFMAPGEYHLVVHIWLQNSKGEFLITKRSPNKGFPNMWEPTGGSALAGDDSLTAALREVREETGLTADPQKGERVLSLLRDDNFLDVWLFRQDFNLSDVVLLEGETCDKMYASVDQILDMYNHGKFVPYSYMQDFMNIINA